MREKIARLLAEMDSKPFDSCDKDRTRLFGQDRTQSEWLDRADRILALMVPGEEEITNFLWKETVWNIGPSHIRKQVAKDLHNWLANRGGE